MGRRDEHISAQVTTSSPRLKARAWCGDFAGLITICIVLKAKSMSARIYAYSIVGYGEMGSSQHKSPHEALAWRLGVDVMTSAEISPYRRTQRCSMPFLVRISIWNGKIKLRADPAILRLVVKANSICENGWSQHQSSHRTCSYSLRSTPTWV